MIRLMLLLIALLPSFAWAQTTVLGKIVKEDLADEPIEMASVSLFLSDSAVALHHYYADIEGRFIFRNLANGRYKLTISYVGYQSRTVTDIEISKKEAEVDLGIIKLLPVNNSLEEIVVTAPKPLIEFGADTLTFNVENSIYAEGSTASDLLKNVPMVSVDADGNPSIAGKNNTRIFIDGAPSDYTGESLTDLLNLLPSDAIQKIEVITNPEVRYGADGDGIINIVLKKGYKLGVTGGIAATAGTLGNYNASTYAAYSDDKLKINGSYGYRSNKNWNESRLDRINYDEDVFVNSFLNQHTSGRGEGQGHNLRGSVNWDITPLQNLRISANYNKNNNKGFSLLNDSRLNDEAIPAESRVQNNRNNNGSDAFSINITYNMKFERDKQEAFTAGFNFFNNQSQQNRLLDRITEMYFNGTLDEYRQLRDNGIDNGRTEIFADYTKPLIKQLTFSAGARLTFGNNDNAQNVWSHDFERKQDTIVSSLTRSFSFQENIYAAYASFRWQTANRWAFRAGLRSEITDVSFNNKQITDPVAYHNLFPNLSVNKSVNRKHNLSISYSMRVARPRENALNPLVDNTNPTNISFGNAQLSPSYSHQFQFGFGTSGRNWSFTPRISYATTNKIIERYRLSPDSLTYGNLGSNKAFTVSLMGNYRIGKGINITGGYTLSRRAYLSQIRLQLAKPGYSHRVNVTITAQLPAKVSLEGHMNYVVNATAQGRNKSNISSGFGLRKMFWQNKLQLRLAAADPFSNRNMMEITDAFNLNGTSYHQSRSSIARTINYTFTVSYKFSNTKKQKEKEEIGKLKKGEG